MITTPRTLDLFGCEEFVRRMWIAFRIIQTQASIFPNKRIVAMRRCFGFFIAVFGLAIAVPGCSGGPQPNDNLAKEGQGLFQDTPPEETTPDSGIQNQPAWSIGVIRVWGKGAEASAQEALIEVRTTGRLREAFLERRGQSYVVAYGRYPSKDDPQAQRDLKRIQELIVNGRRPFATAWLAPPQLAGIGRFPQFDLRQARQTHGNSVAYTLQIGYYGRLDRLPTPEELVEFRAAAEEAAVRLRREGELAFYYHSPRGSTVTIGVFEDWELDTSVAPPVQSEQLQAARDRYPQNLVNGQGVKERVRVQTPEGNMKWVEQIQKSRLVAIPRR